MTKVLVIGYVLNFIAVMIEYKRRPNETGEDMMSQSMGTLFGICPYLSVLILLATEVSAWQSKSRKRK